MTKIFILFIGFFCVQSIYTQDINQILEKVQQGKLDKAKKLIDGVTEKNGNAEAYYVKGMIYWNIYLSENPEYHNLHDNPLEISYKSYKKSIMLDEKKEYTGKVKSELLEGIHTLKNDAAEYIVDEKYTSAYKTLIHVSDFSELVDITDTTLYLNIARLALESDDKPVAIKYYQKLASMRYMDPDIYLTLTDLYKENGDETNQEKTLAIGRKLFPKNELLIINELNYYMEEGNLQKLVTILNDVIRSNPENTLYTYTLGNIYENIKETEKAEEKYLKAMELDPDHFEASFSLGNMYLNKAIELEEEDEKSKLFFQKARTYLEKAHLLDPADRNTLLSLQQLYSLTGEFDKYEKISKKIKSL